MIRNIKFLYSVLILTCIFLYVSTYAQVVINEYCASNISLNTDNYGENEDWIELYNTTGSAIDLSGYFLSDKVNKINKWQFTSGTIPANGYLLVWCSFRNEISGGNYHSNFRLTQCKPEMIILSDPSSVILDTVTMKPTQTNHSRGRTTDGAGTWSLFTSPTPNATNSNPSLEYAVKPSVDLTGGFYSGNISVTLSTTEPNSEIRYTTDGSTPTISSTLYSSPIAILSTTVLRAITISQNAQVPNSFVETNTYFINVTHNIPVISIAGDEVLTLLNGTQINPVGSIELYGRDKLLKTKAVGEFNKHGNDSWFYDQRGIDYVTRDEYGYNYTLKHKIFKTKSRDKFQRIILKAAANDNYPFETGSAHIRDAYVHTLSQLGHLKLDERSYEPCILYANGQYWGVYEIREKTDDHDFTKYYYDQDRFNLQYIKTWGSTWAEYGGNQALTGWSTLYNFIIGNDMSIPANYSQVNSQYNIGSLVDYIVLNAYIVCADWLIWNTGWWRGLNPNGQKKEWRYTLWDMDATFDHYINYTNIPDQSAFADPCNPESFNSGSDPEGHIKILNALMANDDFKQYYISRFIDLSNTTFQCSYMQNLLDSLIAQIEPEMNGQIGRWGGSYTQWQQNVQTMKQFIDDRCAAFAQSMKDCYDLEGPYDLTLDVDPPNSGSIKINSIHPANYPWSGVYFGGVNIILEAVPATGFYFDRWELTSNTVDPGENELKVTLDLNSDETVIAHFTTDSIPDTSVTIVPHDDIFIPNAFSPNGDGNNDVLMVYGANIKEMTFSVYNRWGNVVFSSEDQSSGWDGTKDGKPLESGVYAYKLRLLFTDETVSVRGGNITLMK